MSPASITGQHCNAIEVLYVAGSGRSGSTVLANILGQVEGLVSVGELRYIWERGVQDDRLCGCGEAFSTCPFWQGVMRRAFGEGGVPDAGEARQAQAAEVRLRQVPKLLAEALRDRDAPPSEELADQLRRLYRAVLDESGAQVVVDSSKLPSYGYLLERVPGIVVRVVHLTRDPRAAAWSWLRKKAAPDRGPGGLMVPQGVAHSSALWTIWNLAADLLWFRHADRYLSVRYEDFVRSPATEVQRILDFGAPGSRADMFVDDHSVRLGPNHTVAGNPNRLQHGVTTITEDDEWRAAMPVKQRAVVGMLTLPLLRRYRYPLRAAGH